MKRALISLMALILLLTWFAGSERLTAQELEPQNPEDHTDDVVCGGLQGANLLQNPSFEGAFHPYVPPGGHPDCEHGICQTAQMADGWTPYWRSHDPVDPPEIIRMPEYKPAEDEWVPARTHDGERAQQLFTSFSTHEAGFYQRLSVTPGAIYCFGIWGHSWSSSNDTASTNDSELEQNIGIDPMGGTDWQSGDVIWGGPKQYYYDEPGEQNAFGPLTLVVRAQTSQMTVFTWSRPVWPVKHNDVFWDDAIVIRAPEEPVMSLSHTSVGVLELAAEAQSHTFPIDISFAHDPGIVWRATVDAGGTLDVTLGAAAEDSAAGNGADDLLVNFDSTGYAPGAYEATVTVSSEPDVAGSPATIQVSLHVVEEIYGVYAPLIRR